MRDHSWRCCSLFLCPCSSRAFLTQRLSQYWLWVGLRGREVPMLCSVLKLYSYCHRIEVERDLKYSISCTNGLYMKYTSSPTALRFVQVALSVADHYAFKKERRKLKGEMCANTVPLWNELRMYNTFLKSQCLWIFFPPSISQIHASNAQFFLAFSMDKIIYPLVTNKYKKYIAMKESNSNQFRIYLEKKNLQ